MWSFSFQNHVSIKFPLKVFLRGSFWPALECREIRDHMIIINRHRIAKCMDLKISIDGSAEPLTRQPPSHKFKLKIITKIQKLNRRICENKPLEKLEEYAVVLKTHIISPLMSGLWTVSSTEKPQLFLVWTSAMQNPQPFHLFPLHPEYYKILLLFLKWVFLDIKLVYVSWGFAVIIELICGHWAMVRNRENPHPFPTYTPSCPM